MISKLFRLGVFALAIGIILSFFGSIHPVFDTGANFRLHMCAGLFFFAVVWIIKGAKISGALFAAIASIGFYSGIDSLPVSAKLHAATGSQNTYKLLHLNLFYENPTPRKVFDVINQTKPDIVFLNEFSPVWKDKFGARLNAYSNRARCTEPNGYGGTIILSKFAFEGDTSYCHRFAVLNLKSIMLEGVPVTLGSVHLRWPWPASGPKQVTELAPTLAGLEENALIVGDFNSTPWTYLLQRFAKSGALEIVSGIGPSWIYRLLPTSIAKYVGLPLDNAMRKGAIEIIEAKTLDPVGSDHLPILLEFSLRKPD